MKAGANVGVTQLWETLLEKNANEHKTLIEARLNGLAEKMHKLKEELTALPKIETPEFQPIENSRQIELPFEVEKISPEVKSTER